MANAKTNPGKANTNPNAANGNTLQCTNAVTSNMGTLPNGQVITVSVWATMVANKNGKAYLLNSVNYNAKGNPTGYHVTTQAGLTALVPATAMGNPYTGYTVTGPNYGASKLSMCLGTNNRYNY